jgi:hypothetical protein
VTGAAPNRAVPAASATPTKEAKEAKATPATPVTTATATPTAGMPKKPFMTKIQAAIILVVVLFVASNTAAFFIGKHGQQIIYRKPIPPPITLPAQAIVVNQCVPGLGKQYVIPKDIPHGPIYDVLNSKVIAVEYNYKAQDVFLDPNRLSNTIIPFVRNYQIDHFITTLGLDQLKASSTLADAQSLPIHIVMYIVSSKDAAKITCPTPKSS